MPKAGIVFDNDGLLLDTEPCWTRADMWSSSAMATCSTSRRSAPSSAPRPRQLRVSRATARPARARGGARGRAVRARPGRDRGQRRAQDGRGRAARRARWTLACRRRLELAAKPPAGGLGTHWPRRPLRRGARGRGGRRAEAAPDLYLRACELLGVTHAFGRPRRLAPGVASARAAGLFVVGVPSVAGVELEVDAISTLSPIRRARRSPSSSTEVTPAARGGERGYAVDRQVVRHPFERERALRDSVSVPAEDRAEVRAACWERAVLGDVVGEGREAEDDVGRVAAPVTAPGRRRRANTRATSTPPIAMLRSGLAVSAPPSVCCH